MRNKYTSTHDNMIGVLSKINKFNFKLNKKLYVHNLILDVYYKKEEKCNPANLDSELKRLKKAYPGIFEL